MFDTYSEIFAKRGAAYQQAMAECPDAREAEFRAVLEPLAGRTGLLCDLPSGGGYLARRLPEGWRYVGVDPSDDFVSACRAGVECIKAPITAVPLADGSVDAIVSLAALHHEPDLPAVFREMRRLLKPSGR
ncbi:MAG: class I SAM-dependent methyltransferase, partial [Sphingomicrobium sp.]